MASYRIKISTSIGSSLTGITGNAKFPKCKAGDVCDKFTFRSSCIIIECKRSNLQKKEEVENNPGNTLHIQIMKALLLYYAANLQKARVYSISVTHITNAGKTIVSEIKYSQKNQPLILRTVPVGLAFNQADLVQNVLAEDSHLFETILSHWLGACAVKDRYDVFSRLWRCLEQLSIKVHHAAGTTEKVRLESLRTFIRNNADTRPLSCSHVDTMTYDDFRSYSWKLLIFNNFSRTAKIGTYEAYRDHFVVPYTDERVAHMLQDTLVYRNGELNSYGLLIDVNNHLSTVLGNPVKKDEDIVAILCGCYAYYVRNKFFHGDFSERSFSICRSREDDIIDKLNALMVKLTFELINAYQVL